MLTLSHHADNQEILGMYKGRKRTPIYWHPVNNTELQNSMDGLDYFFKNEDFRDRFQLNEEEAHDICACLSCGEVSQKHQRKYFQCKKYISESLLTEMDLSGTDQVFKISFLKGSDTYPWVRFVCGGSGSGKTHHVLDQIIDNLDGPARDRRFFIYCSAEWTLDKTLSRLKQDKYKHYYRGIDISEEAVKNFEGTPEEFFEQNVLFFTETAPKGSVLICDDAMDTNPIVSELCRKLIIRTMRVGRHRGLGLIYLLHKLKSGSWSSQAYSSAKYIVVFPRSQKNKIRDLLEVDFGIPKKQSRQLVTDFANTGRAMIIHMHSPNYIMNDKLLRLI